MAYASDEVFGIAVVVPLRGAGGLFGPSCRAVAELAAHEINQRSGILGREVELTFVDGGREPKLVAADVARLVASDTVHAVTGWHITPVRHALVGVLRGRVPYVYTALYEGGESRAGVFSSGEFPIVQVAPAMSWLRASCGVTEWSIVGDDYSWPRSSARFVAAAAPELEMTIRGERYVPLGDESAVLRMVDEVEANPPPGLLMLLVGHDAVVFNREFARRGLDAATLRYSPMMDEAMLMAGGEDSNRNLYSSAGYYRSLINADTLDLQGRYNRLHGTFAPALTNTAESCYEGLVTLATLLERAGSLDMDSVNAAIEGLAYDGPRGVVEYHGQQGVYDVHLAQAVGLDFEIVATL